MSASALGCHADSLRAFVAGHRPSLSGHADVHCSGQPMSAFGGKADMTSHQMSNGLEQEARTRIILKHLRMRT